MNLFVLSVASSLLCIVIVCSLKYLSLLRWISGHAYVLSKRREHFSILEMLDLFKNVKPFPISCQKGWKINSYSNGHRVWFSFLTFPHNLNAPSIKVYAVFNLVQSSSQGVLQVLKNISQACEWKPGVISASNTHNQSSLELPATGRGLPSTPVQVDCVKEELLCQRETKLGWYSRDPWCRENVVPTVSLEYKRFWHKEDNGVCWMLQMNEPLQTCEFYLIQPIEDVDQCLVSVVTWSKQHSSSIVDKASVLLSSLMDYISLRKVQKTPLTTITLPQDLSDSDIESSDSAGGHESVGREVPSFSHHVHRSLSDHQVVNSSAHSHLLSEKKKAELEKYSSILRYKCKNGTTKSVSNDEMSTATCLDSRFQSAPSSSPGSGIKVQGYDKAKSALTRSVSDGSTVIFRQKSEVKRKRLDVGDVLDDRIPEQSIPPGVNISNEELEIARLKTMNSHCASELLSETLRASNIHLELAPDKQAESSGGWMFCSFDKNVVVLKKVQRPGSSCQSYIGKGFVLSPPKTVWDAVRNPRTRFTYDDTLKKVDIISTIDDSLKIVYFYHESQQFLTKESCDMCVLHGERQDGQKYILTYSSIDHDKCPVNPNITRAKVLPSGWVIEPAWQDKKVYSIVTYLMQIDFGHAPEGSDSLPFHDMISHYPLSITDLQQYLKPALQILEKKSFS